MTKGKLQDCFQVINYCNIHSIAIRLSFKVYNSYYKANLKYRIGDVVVKINIVTHKLYIREKIASASLNVISINLPHIFHPALFLLL